MLPVKKAILVPNIFGISTSIAHKKSVKKKFDFSQMKVLRKIIFTNERFRFSVRNVFLKYFIIIS